MKELNLTVTRGPSDLLLQKQKLIRPVIKLEMNPSQYRDNINTDGSVMYLQWGGTVKKSSSIGHFARTLQFSLSIKC